MFKDSKGGATFGSPEAEGGQKSEENGGFSSRAAGAYTFNSFFFPECPHAALIVTRLQAPVLPHVAPPAWSKPVLRPECGHQTVAEPVAYRYISRNRFFCTLPIALRGKSSRKWMRFGIL